MNVFASKLACGRLGLLTTMAMAMIFVPPSTLAADGDSAQSVECMLPGQIHTVAGHATMGARHPEQLSPADCRERGGEYTEVAQRSQPAEVPHAPVVAPGGDRIVSCLLPRQPRRLGEKASYKTARHSVRTTASDCSDRGGDVLIAKRAHHSVRKK